MDSATDLSNRPHGRKGVARSRLGPTTARDPKVAVRSSGRLFKAASLKTSAMDPAREIVTRLKKSYAMELESVQNYLANSVQLEGPHAEVKRVLESAVAGELKHARRLAGRIKILGDCVPGSLELPRDQNYLQPPMDNRDSATVVRGALTATDAAIAHYQAIIRITDGLDYVTQDLLIELLAEEQERQGLLNQLLARLNEAAYQTGEIQG